MIPDIVDPETGEVLELEARAGIASHADLLREFETLHDDDYHVWNGLHGANGNWGDHRKNLCDTLASEHADKEPMSEAKADRLAHADKRYKEFLDKSTIEKARLSERKARIEVVRFQLEHQKALLYFRGAEMRLQ